MATHHIRVPFRGGLAPIKLPTGQTHTIVLVGPRPTPSALISGFAPSLSFPGVFLLPDLKALQSFSMKMRNANALFSAIPIQPTMIAATKVCWVIGIFELLIKWWHQKCGKK